MVKKKPHLTGAGFSNKEEIIMTIEEMLEKATIKTSDFATSGLLQPEIANKFVDYVFDLSVMKNNARLEKIAPDQKYIDKVSVGDRVAVPKVEATDPATRRGVITSRVTISTKPIAVPWAISREVLARNIEKQNFEETVARLMATQLSNDLEELFIQGDTTSADTFLALVDGWAKLAQGGHVYDAERKSLATLADARDVLSSLIRSLPAKFKRNRADLRFFVGDNVAQDYIDALSTRATSLGDQALQNKLNLTPFGIPLVRVPLLPTNLPYGDPATNDNSFIMLTHWQNFIAAMEVQYTGSATGIELLKDQDIYANVREYCLHLSAGCAIQETDAVAIATNVKSEEG